MEPVTSSLIVFAFVFGGALLGLFLRTRLPEHYLSEESKNIALLGTGLVGTMAAIVLGMLISSAKSFYDTQNAELTDMSANIVLLDRVLAHYGLEATDARARLREIVNRALDQMQKKDGSAVDQFKYGTNIESIHETIRRLAPKDDAHVAMKSEALSIINYLAGRRWLIYEQSVSSISTPMLIILIFWLTIIFTSFGVHAPTNAMTVTSLCVSALSVSTAVFLMLELYSPFQGFFRVSSAPLRAAFERLGQ